MAPGGGEAVRLAPQRWLLLAASCAVAFGTCAALLLRVHWALGLKSWFRRWTSQARRTLGRPLPGKKPVRVFVDGCFDLMHLGHANALRQAKALGDQLVVGVCSEAEMRKNKGPPVLSTEERLALVGAVKWVDEVIPDTPYCITPEFLDTLFTQHGIDYVVHGDDPCLLPDGTDAYASAKAVGRYREFKRTEGVSSTDILARILSSAKSELSSSLMEFQMAPSPPPPQATSEPTPSPSSTEEGRQPKAKGTGLGRTEAGAGAGSGSCSEGERGSGRSLFGRARRKGGDSSGSGKGSRGAQHKGGEGEAQETGAEARAAGAGARGEGAGAQAEEPRGAPVAQAPQQFLNTARRIVQFADVPRALSAAQRVVYIDGAFDLFHAGHVAILEDARALGDHLIVGVHSDATVSAHRGPHHPILGLQERCMAVLACRHVDDVVIGAPWVLTRDLLKTFGVCTVVRGTVSEPNPLAHDEEGRFEAAAERGMLRVLESRSGVTTSGVMQRVLNSQEEFQKRYQSRTGREQAYYEGKEYVPEG